MPVVLKEFQSKAIEDILNLYVEGPRSVILKSCTGSGKTVVLSHVANRIMEGGGLAVVWLTPGAGELEMQSKAKMDRYVHGASTKTLDDVMTSGIDSGDACFVNWERLNKKGSRALNESERLNLIDRIAAAKDDGVAFVLIIDESHVANTPKSKSIISLFDPVFTIRASATPDYGPKDTVLEVSEDDVIEQGLIKKGIFINPDIPHEAVVENEVEFLVDRANAKRLEVRLAYQRHAVDVNPLVIVQLPDANDKLRAQVEAYLMKLGISVENGRLAIWLSDEHRNVDGIHELNAPQEFIIIKQAVATGWDCPRAHILVKLRDNMTEVFQTQTIGRIRRMPQARHYEDGILDNCYIYTLDAKFIDETKRAVSGRAWEAKALRLKKEHAAVALESEQRETPNLGFDQRAAYKAIRASIVSNCNLTDDVRSNLEILKRAGYVFERRLRDTTQSGNVKHIDAKEIRSLDKIELEVKASQRDLHDACNNRVSKIARDVGIDYAALGKIFRRLFLKGSETAKGDRKLLSLEQADYYAFVANNAGLLKDEIRCALSSEGLERQEKIVLQKRLRTFRFPVECVLQYDATEKDQSTLSKCVYEGYRASAQPRSDGEKRFEAYCEASERVEWFYKNGDKGSEYFSVLYLDNAGRDPLFYPDYIVGDIEGFTWIIEAKGGQKKSGESENVDIYAPKKFAALKSYVDGREGFKMGFVRYDKKSQRLCINSDEYTESLDSLFWRLLKDVL